jgi:hypothetical protein
MTKSWTFRRRSDVERFWREVRDVPRRTNGRKHYQEERFCLGLYLLALATHDLLAYPLRVEEGESPDFMLVWNSGETTGLEVTRATEPSLQRAMTAADHESARRESEAAKSGVEPEPVVITPSLLGYVNDEPERLFCWLVGETIEKKLDKLSKFKAASSYELLVADDLPVGADSRAAFGAMRGWIRSLQPRVVCAFAKISVIKSLDIAFDLGGDFRVLPYIELSSPKLGDPESTRDFADRVEDAARITAEDAIRRHKRAGNPVYSVDARGRLVKETSDGRRFEVEVTPSGSEAIVRELRD